MCLKHTLFNAFDKKWEIQLFKAILLAILSCRPVEKQFYVFSYFLSEYVSNLLFVACLLG